MVVPHPPAPYSFAAARYTVHLRAWTTRASTALALDGTIASSSADSSWVEGIMNPGAVERRSQFWETDLIHSDNANADSPSGDRERHLFTFNVLLDPAPDDPVP